MVAKCTAHQVLHTIGADLAPQQLGCGIPLSCEAAVHAAHLYLHNTPSDHQLLKLNFKNEFNSLRLDKMLSAVRVATPELLKFVYSAYSVPLQFYCGDHVIQSAEGVQQGDLLGPPLFCLTIQRLVLKLKSEFKVFYLDDGTLGGPVQDVLHNFKLVKRQLLWACSSTKVRLRLCVTMLKYVRPCYVRLLVYALLVAAWQYRLTHLSVVLGVLITC